MLPGASMATLLQDLRFAIRQLRKRPGFALTTTLTLALGIGVTTAIFSLFHAVLLQPLPLPEPDRLVWLQKADQSLGFASERLSYPDFFDWRAQSRSFTGMACYRGSSVTLTGSGESRQLVSETVSVDLFRVLGVHPMLGRDFLPEEEKAGSRVAILSYQSWQSIFGAARDIAGRSITLNGKSYTVAGVAPKDFVFPIQPNAPELWTTLADDASGETPMTTQRGADMLEVVARLKPGVTPAQARAELNVIAGNLAAQYPGTNKQYTTTVVEPQLEHLVGDFRPALRVLFAAVGLVLMIACANVAGLLLARAASRRPEIAVRTALGAGRAQITRQVLVESVFLSLCGGALGILLATWILDTLLRFVPASLPRLDRVSIDGPVLAFATVMSVLTGLLFGVAPAWRMSRLDRALALRAGARGATPQHRLHNWLVIAETAVGLILLIGSGLLIRSFVRVLRVDPGFDSHHVLTASLSLPPNQYPNQQRVRFYDQLLSRLATLHGVQSVAAGWPLPLSSSNIGISFQIEGRFTAPGDAPSEPLTVVTADYFQTMRIPILSGRAFTARDDSKSKPVIIINDRFARKYFPGENPIGKHMRSDLGDGTLKAPMREIVGVVGSVKRRRLTAEPDPQYYLPWAQAVITSPTLCIRTTGDPTSLVSAVRAQLAEMDRNVPLYRVRTLDEFVERADAVERDVPVHLRQLGAHCGDQACGIACRTDA